jgi:hypothetical protein
MLSQLSYRPEVRVERAALRSAGHGGDAFEPALSNQIKWWA